MEPELVEAEAQDEAEHGTDAETGQVEHGQLGERLFDLAGERRVVVHALGLIDDEPVVSWIDRERAFDAIAVEILPPTG